MTGAPASRSGPACLVTAGGPGAAEVLRRVAALGWEAVAAPMLTTAALALGAVPAVQAALLTSAAAVPSLAAGLPRGVPVLAVGEATAAAARAARFRDVAAAAGDAASLAALCEARLDPARGTLLLAMGEGYGDDLAASLRAGGFRVTLRTAYAVREAVALPTVARAALEGGAARAVLVLSPRGGAILLRLLREAGLEGRATGLRALALSPRIGGVLSGVGWGRLEVAPRPSLDSLLGVLGMADGSGFAGPDGTGSGPG